MVVTRYCLHACICSIIVTESVSSHDIQMYILSKICLFYLEIIELVYIGCKYGWSLIILFPFQQDLDELPLEAETVERGYSLPETATGLPKIHGLSTSSLYSTGSSGDYYEASPKNTESIKSSHAGELQSPLHANMDSN